MGTQQPAVSIGLPVYNGERFIRDSLDSITRQTFRSFELIISDNASTDATADICRSYASVDSRIRYVRNQVNIGAAGNFNKVFEMASAPLFRWATADDVFRRDSLECCVRVMEQHPEAVLCYPRTVLIDTMGNELRDVDENLDVRLEDPIERFCVVFERIKLVNVQYGLMRADAVRKTALFRNFGGGDIPFVLELSLCGSFIEVPGTVFYRRMHEQASSAIRTSIEEQQFWDPSLQRRKSLRLWKHYWAYLGIARSASLDLWQRVRLTMIIVRNAIMSRHKLWGELVGGIKR